MKPVSVLLVKNRLAIVVALVFGIVMGLGLAGSPARAEPPDATGLAITFMTETDPEVFVLRNQTPFAVSTRGYRILQPCREIWVNVEITEDVVLEPGMSVAVFTGWQFETSPALARAYTLNGQEPIYLDHAENLFPDEYGLIEVRDPRLALTDEFSWTRR